MRLLLLMAVSSVLLLGSAASPARSQPTPPTDIETPSGQQDPPSAMDIGCLATGTVGGLMCATVSGAAGLGLESVVSSGANAVLRHVVDFVVDGAGWLLGQIAHVIDSSTRPELTSGWFRDAYRDMALIAGMGLLPFVLLAVMQGLFRQDAGMLLRAAFVHLPVAIVGTAGAVVLVDILLRITDWLSAWIGRGLSDDLSSFAASVGHALAGLGVQAGGPVAGLAALLGAAVIAFATFVIWLELLLRQAAIYVAVLFLPLAFMGLVWPATGHWLRRLIDGLLAVILSKFVIVAVMALAASALDVDLPAEGFGTVIAGGAMLSLAALAPYVLLRFMPVFDVGLSSQFEGAARRPTAAVAAPSGNRMVDLVRQRSTQGSDRPAASRTISGSPAGAGAKGRAAFVSAAASQTRSGSGEAEAGLTVRPVSVGSAGPGGAVGRTEPSEHRDATPPPAGPASRSAASRSRPVPPMPPPPTSDDGGEPR